MRFYVWLISLIAVSANAYGQTPTLASANVIFNDTYCSQTTVSWTSGNGTGRIVIARKDAAVSSLPSNNNYYLPRDSFGNGHSFSATEFVVYNGNSNSVIVKNLEANTTYYFSVFEYNGAGQVFNYKTNSYPEASVTTENLVADFTIDDDYQCYPQNEFNYTENVTQSSSNVISYFWSFGDGGTSILEDPTYSYTDSGSFEVKLRVTSTGCSNTKIKRDTVVPMPRPAFGMDPAFADNNSVQCFYKADGSSNEFNFRNQTSQANYSEFKVSVDAWLFGDGSSSTSTGLKQKKSYAQPGMYEVKCILRSTMNQFVESCIDSATLIVNVKPRPIDSSKVLFSDTSMCLNGNAFYLDNLSSDFSATSKWYFGDGDSAVGTSVVHSYATPGIYAVNLEVTDTAGCYDEYSDTIEVVAQPNNYYNGLDSNYCVGDAVVNLTPNLIGGKFIGDNVDDVNQQFNPEAIGERVISYIITVGDCIDTFTRKTNVIPLPVFELGNDTSICLGSQLDLNISRGNAAILWSNTSTDSFISESQQGTIWARKTEQGCSFRDSLDLTVLTAPVVNLGNDSLLCGDGIREIDVSALNATYVWNDGYLGGGKRTITETGVYEVTVTNKCGTESDDVDLTFLPYACDIFIPNAFTPNGDNLNALFKPSGNVTLKQMQIFNRWGELLYDHTGVDIGWDGTANGVNVMSGFYYYLIRYELPQGGTTIPKVASGEVYVLY